MVTFLKRQEVLTLIVAILVTALGALAATSGVEPLAEQSIASVVTAAWALVIGAIFEGKIPQWLNADYVGGTKQLLASRKFQVAVIGVLMQVIVMLAETAGIDIPVESLTELLSWLWLVILSIAGVDVLGAKLQASPSGGA